MEQCGHSTPAERSNSQCPSSSSYATAEEDPFGHSACHSLGASHKLQSRIKYLEGKLAEKEEALCALKLELEAARDTSTVDASIGPLSFGPEEEYKLHLAGYLTKLQENSSAIAHRDEIIHKLGAALKQRILDQEALNGQVASLTEIVQCLQSQLHTVSQHLQEPQRKLLSSLKDKERELQGKTAELALCKTQSANEVQSLMHSLEQLQQHGFRALALSCPVDSKTSQQQREEEIGKMRQHYDSEIKRLQKDAELACEAESVLNAKLAASQQDCDKLTAELQSLRLTHDAVVSSLNEEFQRNLYQYDKEQNALKEQVKTLQKNLEISLNQSSLFESKLQSLNSQLKDKTEQCVQQRAELHRIHSEHSSEAASSQQIIEQYKNQLDNIKIEFSKTLAHKHAELVLLQEQMEQLKETYTKEKSLHQRDSAEKEQKLSEELQSIQLSYENEIKASKRELERLRSELKEKAAVIVSKEQHIGTLEKKLSSGNEICLEYRETIHSLNQKLKNSKAEKSNLNSSHENVSTFSDAKYEAIDELKHFKDLCAKHSSKIKILESDLREMSNVNANLKEQLKNAENELNRVQNEYLKCKADFQEEHSVLRQELALKEEELENLVKCGEILSHKDEIHSINAQVKELLDVKSTLEDTLAMCYDKHNKEISHFKERATALEKKLSKESEHFEYGALVKLVNDCCRDLQMFKDMQITASDLHGDDEGCQYNGEILLSKILDEDNAIESSHLKKICKNLSETNAELCRKLKEGRVFGIQYLEQLLKVCYDTVNRQDGPEETVATHLTKSKVLVEKLQIQMEEAVAQSSSVSKECEMLKAYCRVLENKLGGPHCVSSVEVERPDNGHCPDANQSSQAPVDISYWVHNCKTLEEKNRFLSMELHLSQVKLEEYEVKLFSDVSKAQTETIQRDSKSRFDIMKDFEEQCETLLSKMEDLCSELSSKEALCLERVQEAIHRKLSETENETIQCKLKLVLGDAIKSFEILLLQGQVQKLKLGHQMFELLKDKQKHEIRQLVSMLEDSWHENSSLQTDLRNSLQEAKTLRGKMQRVEAFHGCMREKSSVIEPGLMQIIETLETTLSSSLSLSSGKSLPTQPSLPMVDQIDSCIKLSSKVMVERESLLANLEYSDSKVAGYQSEVLNLHRLHSSLQDLRDALVNRSGPVIQVHVDFLNHQLEKQKLMYQDACNSMFKLEGELRDLEQQKDQQEEKFEEELSKLRIAAKYWQLKSEIAQVSVVEQDSHTDSSLEFSNILNQLNTIYSACSSAMSFELERTASVWKEQIQIEIAEQISDLELKHKNHLTEIVQNLQTDPSWKELQILHKQELAASNAVHEYNSLKKVLEVRKQLTESVDHSLHLKPPSVHSLALELMKYDLTTQYKATLRKIALNWTNQWEKELSRFDGQLKFVSAQESIHDAAPHSVDLNLGPIENILSECKLFSEKLRTLYSTELQSCVFSFEKEFHAISKKLQEINVNFQNAVNVAVLQEELKQLEEKHRLAIESLTARHNAEETRLRLMMSSADMAKAGDSNETSSLVALRKELEEKHKREMEDLRTYFEQKCADFEKHYSEEVFSQHSRKMSDCSSASESEIVSEMYYAGPGSASSVGPTIQPHLCDSLGESSFKDLEEQAQTIDFEKLLQESREQLEAMRIALDSRHQGELETQREVYEARVEELVRNMDESHSAELRFQSRKLQELQDVEKLLKSQLTAAEEEIKSLKCQLNERGQRGPELSSQVQLLSDALKKKESESCEHIATLKAKLRENCEAMSKMDRDITNLKAKHDGELASIKSVLSDKDSKIEDLLSRIQKQLEDEREWKEQVQMKLKEEFESAFKVQLADKLNEKSAEMDRRLEDQRSQLLSQQKLLLFKKDEENKQALFEVEGKFENLLKEKEAHLDAKYSEYLEFVKKCADETKIKLIENHRKELEDLTCRFEHNSAVVKPEQRVEPAPDFDKYIISETRCSHGNVSLTLEMLLQTRGWTDNDSVPKDCFLELIKMSQELQESHQSELKMLIGKHNLDLCSKEREQDSVREDCERRFQLQLEEARTDIVRALERHIQQLLDDDDNESEKPHELQQLEKKLSNKYRLKMEEIQGRHEKEVAEMQRVHAAQLERARRNPPISCAELSHLYKERDCLRNVAASLRDVVAELVRYFMSCEDELNTTLMTELAHLDSERDNELLSITNHEENSTAQDASAGEEGVPVIVATPARGGLGLRSTLCPKRVRFAPDVSGLLSFIDDDSILEGVGLAASMRDASLDFHEELDRCLERLRRESAALLEMSRPPDSSGLPALPDGSDQGEMGQLRSQLEDARQAKEHLSSRLSNSRRSLKQLQQENEQLRAELDAMREEREKLLAELQLGQLGRLGQLGPPSRAGSDGSDLVAEGYGEGEGGSDNNGSPRATSLEELQDKARTLLLGVHDGALSPNSTQQQVVEELCRDWERLAEEGRRRQDDLQRQVEAADKQLRSTRVFLDEQAAEREQERDDFVREIQHLQDQLRDKDRERNTQQLMNRESCGVDCMSQMHLGNPAKVEALENQLKESQTAHQEAASKVEKLDAERKQAVDKIWTLRDIISDLELQVATKSEEASTIQAQNDSLQRLLEQQGRTQFELAQEMEVLQHRSGNGALLDRIRQLEEHLRKHELQAEQFGDLSAVQQIKSQLRDLEISLESRTREMESVHASATAPVSPCLSSPSEDVSIRETLEAMRAASGNTSASRARSPITLPVDEVTRLQEQWQRHLRMEDALLKKVRDLDMRLDDIQAEKQVLSKRLQEQMHLASTREAKLDEHRRKVEAKQLEVTSPLHRRIEDLEGEVQTYAETLDTRERQIKNLESALHQAKLNFSVQEAEIRKNVQADHTSSIQLQLQISKLAAEKDKLQELLSEKHEAHSSLPVLIESMLADKNADIDRLEKQVQELTKQIEQGSQYIATPSSTLEFEYCEQEKVRAHVELSPILELKRSFDISTNPLEKTQLKDSPSIEISLPPLIEPASLCLESDSLQPVVFSPKPISGDDSTAPVHVIKNTIIPSSASNSPTVSNSDQSCKHESVKSLKSELVDKEKQLHDCMTKLSEKSQLIIQLNEKLRILEGCEIKVAEMSSLEKELQAVREDLQRTVSGVNSDKEFFETQLNAKDAEVEHLRDELCATQDLIVNLQRKVQEAKQIAVSPNRSSPDTKLALQQSQSDLESAYMENRALRNKLTMVTTEIEKERLLKEAQLTELYECEREKVSSLQEKLLTYQQEKLSSDERTLREKQIEHELLLAKDELKCKQDEAEQLQNELKQLNAECVALKRQLNIPITEAAALAEKLDSEKKFSKALQEELSTYKNKAENFELKCQHLYDRIKELEISSQNEYRVASIVEENESLQAEISQLKGFLQDSRANHNCMTETIKKLEQEIVKLKEKISDLDKAKSDLKKLLKKYYDLESSCKELQKLSHEKSSQLQNAHEFPGLADEDSNAIHDIQKQLGTLALKGGGDGPWQRLSTSDLNVYEIKPDSSQLSDSGSLDDLTGMVQQELDLSVRLDDTLLQSLDPLTKPKTANKVAEKLQEAALGVDRVDTGNQSNHRVQQQSFTFSQIERSDIEHLQNRVVNLQRQLSKETASVQLLQNQVDSLHKQYGILQKQDSDLIEDLRLKLARALDIERELREQLDLEINKGVSVSSACPPPILYDIPKPIETSKLLHSDATNTLQEQLRAVSFELEMVKMEKDSNDKKLRRLQEAEVRRSRRRALNEEQHRSQISRLQAAQSEKQEEYSVLRQQLSKVTDELQLTRKELIRERESQLVGNTPLMDRLKEMNVFLEELIEENRRMTKQMENFTEEHKKLQRRNALLEQQLFDMRKSETASSAQSAFAGAMHFGVTDPDLEDRVNNLFGRFLRSESFRKALIWQKRYLLSVINGINECKSLTQSHFSSIKYIQPPPQKRPLPRQRFRSAVFSIIAIRRMHFLVDKWHRGKRIGCCVVLNDPFTGASSLHGRLASSSADRFQGGLPQSPPTLEKPRQFRSQSCTSSLTRLSSSNPVHSTDNLSEYAKQFDSVNNLFSALLSHPPK